MVSIHQLDKDQRLLTNSDLLSVSEDTLHEDLQRLLLGIPSISIFIHNLHNGIENTLIVWAEGTEQKGTASTSPVQDQISKLS